MLLEELENALRAGCEDQDFNWELSYRNITQPSALYLIRRKLGKQVDLRFYNREKQVLIIPSPISSTTRITSEVYHRFIETSLGAR